MWKAPVLHCWCRLPSKCDGTRAETRICLSAKRTSPFKLAGVSVQSTTGSRVVPISGSNAGYTMFQGSVKSTGYPLYSPVSHSPPLPCVTVCHHVSSGIYHWPIVLSTRQTGLWSNCIHVGLPHCWQSNKKNFLRCHMLYGIISYHIIYIISLYIISYIM